MKLWKRLPAFKGFDQKKATDDDSKLHLEELESRFMLSTFSVTTTADSGFGSLREAIVSSNASAGLDTIEFNIGSGHQVIQPLSDLPTITEPLNVDGNSQPGFAGQPLIELDGSAAGAGSHGLRIIGGNSTVSGLVINNFDRHGIFISAGGSNRIQGNYIGTDFLGTSDQGNGGRGVAILNSSDNVIGGSKESTINVISGNSLHGVWIGGATSTDNHVRGNFIGTDASGTLDLGNSVRGVFINQSNDNRIGGVSAGSRNVISGNDHGGVRIYQSTGNQVFGNFIGTDLSGTVGLGNTLNGIWIDNSSETEIGGNSSGTRNVISSNSRDGLVIRGSLASDNAVHRNLIGTDVNGTADLGNSWRGIVVRGSNDNEIGSSGDGGNTIAFNQQEGVVIKGSSFGNSVHGNSIFSNVNLGIDLRDDGITLNDPGDPDAGANNLQNFPVLTQLTKLVDGSFAGDYEIDSSTANSVYPLHVEFFAADSSGLQGMTFLGSDIYTTPGTESFLLPPTSIPLGQPILLTATDDNGNTSEFSIFDPAVIVDNSPLNDPPAVAFNRPANVDEGGMVEITTFNLEEGDPDDSGADLTYTVLSPLSHGVLKVNGVAAVQFTQADIDANLVTYSHDGVESTSDVFEFSLSDGGEDGAVPAVGVFTIDVNPINDPPVLVTNNSLAVSTGGSAKIDTSVLDGFDPDDKPSGLNYTITSGPSNGQIELTSNPGVAITSFSQGKLNNNRVKYVNNGTPGADSFDFSFADGGENGSLPVAGTFIIDVGVNDQPIIDTNMGARVNEGGLVTIIDSMLKATDPDDFGAGLSFTLIANPSDGALLLDGSAMDAGDSTRNEFTQLDIDNNRIAYLHDGGESTADSFDFSLADGGEDGTIAVPGTFILTINPIDDPPVLETNSGLTVETAGTIIINNTQLNEGDPDDDGADVYYFFQSGIGAVPVNGTLFFDADGPGAGLPVPIAIDTNFILGLETGATDFFTQEDLDNGLVSYQHDGSGESSDMFAFILGTDPQVLGGGNMQLQVFGETATVHISIDTPGNDIPDLANLESGPLQFVKGGTSIQITNEVTVTDVDDANMEGATVRISSNFEVGDELLFTDALGVTGSYNSSTGVLSLTGSASKLAYQGLMRTVQFVNNNAGVSSSVRTIEFVVNDGDNDSNSLTRDINVVLSVPPTLDLDVDDSTTPSESLDAIVEFDGVPVNLTSGVIINDVDDTNMESSSITLTNALDGTDEFLAIDTAMASLLGITVNFGANNQSIQLSGSATNTEYAQLLDTVTYDDVATSRNTATRVIEFVVNDGNENSMIARSFIASESPSLMIGAESTDAIVFFNTQQLEAILVPVESAISDPDDTSMESATITHTNPFGNNDGINPPLEFLTIDEVLAASHGIGFHYDPLNPILITLTGTATLSQYQDVFDSAKYHYVNSFFNINRVVEFVVNDGEQNSNVATSTVLDPGD